MWFIWIITGRSESYRTLQRISSKELKGNRKTFISDASLVMKIFDIPWVTWFTHTHKPKWASAQGTYNKFNVLTLDLCLALRRNGNTADIRLDKHGSTLSNQHEPEDNEKNTFMVKSRFMDTPLIRTPCYHRVGFVPGERKALHFLWIQST